MILVKDFFYIENTKDKYDAHACLNFGMCVVLDCASRHTRHTPTSYSVFLLIFDQSTLSQRKQNMAHSTPLMPWIKKELETYGKFINHQPTLWQPLPLATTSMESHQMPHLSKVKQCGEELCNDYG